MYIWSLWRQHLRPVELRPAVLYLFFVNLPRKIGHGRDIHLRLSSLLQFYLELRHLLLEFSFQLILLLHIGHPLLLQLLHFQPDFILFLLALRPLPLQVILSMALDVRILLYEHRLGFTIVFLSVF